MSRVSGTAEQVRLKVLRGDVAPGERVVELQLAESLRVPRPTLREALRQLEGRGLLTADYSGGMHVVALDEAEFEETLQTRAALETFTARTAAERRGRGEIGAQELSRGSRFAGAAPARGPEAAARAERAFHLAVAALAGNGACRRALDRLFDRLLLAALQSEPWSRRLTSGAGDHRRLLDAIAEGDPEGAEAIARHHALAPADA
jgi:DNA-binding GntR family transcriptional regulator